MGEEAVWSWLYREKPRSGRPSAGTRTCAGVNASPERWVNKSVPTQSQKLVNPVTTSITHTKSDVSLRAYRLLFVTELTDDDMPRSYEAFGNSLHVDLRSSAMLRSAEWQLLADVSRVIIGHISEGSSCPSRMQSSLTAWTLADGTDRLSRNVGN